MCCRWRRGCSRGSLPFFRGSRVVVCGSSLHVGRGETCWGRDGPGMAGYGRHWVGCVQFPPDIDPGLAKPTPKG